MSVVSRRKKRPKPGRKNYLYVREGVGQATSWAGHHYYYGYFRKIQKWFGFEPNLREWFLSNDWPIVYYPKGGLSKIKWTAISRLQLLITQGLHWKGEVDKLEEALNITMPLVAPRVVNLTDTEIRGCAVDLKTKKVSYEHLHTEHWHGKGRHCDLCVSSNKVYIDRSMLSWMAWNMSDKQGVIKMIKLYPLA